MPDGPALKRDVCFNLKKYLKKEAVFDILANLPLFFYLPYIGYSFSLNQEDIDAMNEDQVLIVCMALRTLRLVHLFEI